MTLHSTTGRDLRVSRACRRAAALMALRLRLARTIA
jgi:hypothetical protein